MFFFICFCLLFLFVLGGLKSSGVVEACLDRCCLDSWDSLVLLDYVSFFCLLMLFLCGGAVLLFNNHYFKEDGESGLSLSRILTMFLGVMGFLVLSYNLLSTLIMWEYLGLVSFFLILFYSNLDSLRATLITLVASRFGDVCLFGLVMSVFVFGLSGGFFFSVLVLLIVCTKSACFPFISWLLEAMRAPTPVSALVHSSTLVAAGVWFLFRYGGGFLSFSSELELFFFVLCLSTIIISSFCSLVFFDLKKIVALSTCNNVSWCIIFFLLGDVALGLFQLLSHGVAKCYLFISLGDLMSCSSSSQDSRGVYCSGYTGLYLLGLQNILVLSLSGLPFIGIFFSKHALLVDFLWSCNIFCYCLLFFAFMLSCSYSFRFLCLLSGFNSGKINFFGSFFLFICFPSILSGVLNCFCVGSVVESFFLGVWNSLLLLSVQIIGCLAGVLIYFIGFSGVFPLWGLFIWGCDCLVGLFYLSFSNFYSLFLFFLYRWELGVFSRIWGLVSGSYRSFGLEWCSLKFLVLSSGCLLVLCLISC